MLKLSINSKLWPDLEDAHTDVRRMVQDYNGSAVVLENVAVGTAETPVPHGLGVIPGHVTVRKFADARVWESKAATALLLFLRASVAVTCNVRVER